MKLKSVFFSLVALMYAAMVYAQEPEEIKLASPDKTRGTAVMKALSDRHSERAFEDKKLSDQDLSDLLWAANGINRPDGKRTAPSASNKQEIDLYVILAEGAYLYNAKTHSLQGIAQGDLRPLVAGGQAFVKSASVCIVLVADYTRSGGTSAGNKQTAAVDAGLICQNINIFCAATGLATVPRSSMQKAELSKALKLKDTQGAIINNPVGYPKK